MIEGSHDGHIFTVPQQADQRRERHRLRLPRDRRRTGTAGPAAALPRQPGQLGSRADRRAGAGPACHNVRQRRRGRLERDNAPTVAQMAHDAIAFLDAMQIGQADILGFSIGSFVAQDIALIRPAIVRRLVLASAAPQGAAGMHGWARDVIGAVGTGQTSPQQYLEVFFSPSSSSRQVGQEVLGRIYARTQDRDAVTTWATREAQYDAVCTWGIPNHAKLQRLSAIDMPVLVANGDSDPMILPHYSYLLGGLIPQARVKIY